jgi:hypothetical protein
MMESVLTGDIQYKYARRSPSFLQSLDCGTVKRHKFGNRPLLRQLSYDQGSGPVPMFWEPPSSGSVNVAKWRLLRHRRNELG